MNYLAIDIGGTTVKMGVFTGNGENIAKWEIKTRTENAGEAILPDIAASILEKIDELELVRENILGVGIGIPAPVTADGCIPGAVNLGWGARSIKNDLESLCGLKVAVGNDAVTSGLDYRKVIDNGVIVEENSPEEFFSSPKSPRLVDFLSKVL